MNIYWMDRKKLNKTITEKIKPAAVVLDIGCGIRPQKFQTPLVHICCEPFGQYVKHLQKLVRQKKNQDRYIVIHADWEKATKIFPPYSVDTVYLIDVIEHLKKNKGLLLLKKTEKIARKQIVIFTPLGFLEQKHPDGKDAWGMSGGKMQEHRSGWEPEDFDSTWDIYATEEYHKTDNMGHFYEQSHGAFFAIKNIDLPKSERETWLIRVANSFNAFKERLKRKVRKYFIEKIGKGIE